MAGPQRFYHITELATQRYNVTDYDSWHHSFVSQSQNEEHNHEQNLIDLGRIIGGLKDAQRTKLFELCGSMIGNKFTLQRRDADNELSPRYVDVDGQNLAVASTGTRLLMTLLGLCMDEQFDYLLIDEPELGLSPRLQGELARFFAQKDQRDKFFPHLKGIFVATHSHLMLDKQNISNNFVVSKEGPNINLRQVATLSDLHQLQFNMLGNTLEDLFLPAAIVICEGKTDKPFIERAIQLRLPGRRILVIEGQGDVKRIFNNLCNSLGDIRKSPFRDRTFIVLDSVHSAGTKAGLEALGAWPQNIIVWSKNGIEYFYPPSLVADAFSCGIDALSGMKIDDDNVVVGTIVLRKVQLADEIIRNILSSTEHSGEFETKLLKPLSLIVG
jgi:AAA domain, putative AbiEii toxin, Type IV TA system